MAAADAGLSQRAARSPSSPQSLGDGRRGDRGALTPRSASGASTRPTTAEGNRRRRPHRGRERRARRRSTTDATAIFLREISRHPLRTADEEKEELARRVEAGDARGQGAHGQLEPAARRLHRAPLPELGALPARPHPGGNARPDPGRGEVRLATRLPFDLRDPVDPAGHPARTGQSVPHHPGCRRHSRSSTSRGCRAPSASSSPAPSRTRAWPRSPRRPGCRRSGSPWCATSRAR